MLRKALTLFELRYIISKSISIESYNIYIYIRAEILIRLLDYILK